MANRRMFSLSIVDSDAFLELSKDAQLLYYYIGMRCDDDGVHAKINTSIRTLGVGKDALQELLDKRFLLAFDSGIVVVKHWKINNQISKDRYKPTTYKEEIAQLTLDDKNAYTEICKQNVNKMYTECNTNCIQDVIQSVNNLETQYSIDKYSIVKNSIKEENIEKKNEDANALPPLPDTPPLPENWKEEVKKEKAKKKIKQFTPPTIEEIRKYVVEKDLSVDPERFFEYFEEGNWVDSNGKKVRNWKQKILTWDNKNNTKGASPYNSTNARNKPSNNKSPVPTPDWYNNYRKELEEHSKNQQQEESSKSNNDSEITKAAKELFG